MSLSHFKAILVTLPPLTIPPGRATTFELFNDLPRELRNRIWSLAAHEPRIIAVVDTRSCEDWNADVKDQLRHPAILQTSRESRSEGLRYYSLVHEKGRVVKRWQTPANIPGDAADTRRNFLEYAKVKTKILAPRAIYVNFEVDKFHLSGETGQFVNDSPIDQYNFEPIVLQRIRRLILSIHYYLPSPFPRTLMRAGDVSSLEVAIKSWPVFHDRIKGGLWQREKEPIMRKKFLENMTAITGLTVPVEKRTLTFTWVPVLLQPEVEQSEDLVPCLEPNAQTL